MRYYDKEKGERGQPLLVKSGTSDRNIETFEKEAADVVQSNVVHSTTHNISNLHDIIITS